MSRPVSHIAIVGALLKKELKAYSRDTLYLILTLAMLVIIIALFPFLPDSVDESITLAVSPSISTLVDEAREELVALGATPEQLAALDEADLSGQEEGLNLLEFEDTQEMERAIKGELEVWRTDAGETVLRDKAAGDDKPKDARRENVDVGIAFPADFIAGVAAAEKELTVTIYADAGISPEIRDAMTSFVREAAYRLAGRELPVGLPDEEAIVLGEDRSGDQVTLQEKMRPLFVFMILLMETFSLASLVSTEVLQRTVTAVLVTPARVVDFLAAKAIFGTLMSFSQGVILVTFIGGLTADNWLLVLTALLIGSMMFTGVGLFVGSAGKDFLGQLFYAMLFTVPLVIPSMSVMFPGSAGTWVKAIPTYPIIDVLVGAFNHGATWSDSWRSLAYAFAWLMVVFGAGLAALKRKVETL
jgi:ABC-2 type transport system permease protein